MRRQGLRHPRAFRERTCRAKCVARGRAKSTGRRDGPSRHRLRARPPHCKSREMVRWSPALASGTTVAGSPRWSRSPSHLQAADISGLPMAPIELVATVGEEGEGNLRGARHYFDAREREAMVAAARSGRARWPGRRQHRASCGGIAAHPRCTDGTRWTQLGRPRRPESGARRSASPFGDCAKRSRRFRFRASMTVTRMGGGERLTAIAEQRLVRRRTFARCVRNALRDCREVLDNIASGRRSEAAVRDRDAGRTTRRVAGLTTIRSCTRARVPRGGVAWRRCPRMASTDANIPLSRGIPAITIGAGGTGGGAHTIAEWYDNRNGPRGIARALGIITALAAD